MTIIVKSVLFYYFYTVAADLQDDAKNLLEQWRNSGGISEGDFKNLMDHIKDGRISESDLKNLVDQATQLLKKGNGKISEADAKNLMDQAKQLLKDGVDPVNGGNMIQISSMGIFMTVLAIFNL